MSSFGNFVQCRVVAPLAIGATAADLFAATAPYTLPPESGGLLVLVDSPGNPSFIEVIRYTARSGLQLQGITRGVEGTVARAWTGTVYAFQSLMADEYQTLVTAVAAKQASHANLTALSGLTGAADRLPYFTGAGALSLATLTSKAQELLAAVDAAGLRSILEVDSSAQADARYGRLATANTWAANQSVAANVIFSGNGRRITGNFSSGVGSRANRTIFQSSVTDGQTQVTAIPNGVSKTAGFQAYTNSADLENSSAVNLSIQETVAALTVEKSGAGTHLPLVIATGGAERMRIHASGRISIGNGEDDGSAALNVTGGIRASGVLDAESVELFGATPFIDFHHANSAADYTHRLIATSARNLGYSVSSGAGQATFTVDGRILLEGAASGLGGICANSIGFDQFVANGWKKTAFAATGSFGGGLSLVDTGGGQDGFAIYTSGFPSSLRIQYGANGGALSNGVRLDSTATSWVSASDERLKDIIEPITSAVNKVRQLRSVIGKYKTDSLDMRRAMLIAQDVQKVLPEVVSEDSSNGMLGVSYTEIIPLLVAALNEATTLIEMEAQRQDELEARIAALEA